MQRLVIPNRPGAVVPVVAGLVVLFGALTAGAVIGLRPGLAPAILASPLAIAAIWIAYRAPGLTFAAYLAIPFYKVATEPYLPIDLTIIVALVNVMQAVLFFVPSTSVTGDRSRDPARRRGILIWFSLSILIVLGSLYAPAPDVAFDRALNWIMLAALPLLAAFRVASDPRFVRQFLWTLFAIGVAVTLAGLWLLPQVGAWPADRLIVFGAHTIRVGQAALLVPMIGIAFVLPTSRSMVRLACLALLPPALLVSASSGSRGPLIMVAATFALFALRALAIRTFGRRGPFTIAPLRIAVIGLVVGLLISLLQPSALLTILPATATDRLSTVTDIVSGLVSQNLDESAPDTSTADRLVAYDGAVDMFNESPIFGGGTASFASFTGASELSEWTAEVAYPHNLILQFAAEYGIVGLLVLAVLLITAFRGLIARGRDPDWNGILVLLVFFLFSAIVSSGIIDNRTLWGLVALGIAATTLNSGAQAVHAAPANGRRVVQQRGTRLA
jgi:O-antigen ligase